MILWIFKYLWVVILIGIAVLMEYVFCGCAIDAYRRFGDPGDIIVTLIIHAIILGCASFIYWCCGAPSPM